MQGHRFTVSVHLHGTLGANASGAFKLPCAAILEGVSSNNSAASNGLLDVGTSADADGIYAAISIGNSSTPTLVTTANYNGALATANQPYYLAAGTIVKWLLDYDGAAGTAAANATINFYFLEA